MRLSPKFLLGVVENDVQKIPLHIKVLVLALFVYTLAWGVLEPLESIYFSGFVTSYFEIGVIFALFNIAILFLSIFVGALSDRISATRLAPLGMLMYPAIGAFYFSITNFVQLSVTRLLNGLGASLVWISSESYIRRESPKGKTAETFGFYSSMVNLAYVVGAIGGAFLVVHYTPRELFLLLIPFSAIASMIVWLINTRKKKQETIIQGIEDVLEKDGAGTREIMDFFSGGKAAWYCLLLSFFGGIFAQMLLIFIPLGAKEISINLSGIMLLYALTHVPLFAGFFFAEMADRIGKTKTIFYGLLLAAAVLFLISALYADPVVFVALCFMFGLSLAVIGPALNGLITDVTPKDESGEVTGIVNASYFLGGAIGPIALGAIADLFGFFSSFMAAGIITFMLAILTFSMKGFLTGKEKRCR